MDLERRIAQLSPAKLALLEQKLKKNKPVSATATQAKGALRPKYAPLSFSQERLWFLEQMEPDSCVYNIPTILPLRGAINPRLVEESVNQIVARHGSLRTRFVVKDDNPYQVISDAVSDGLDFSIIDLRGPSSPSVSQTLNDHIWVPFNLATGPLLRVRLILQPNNESLLLVVMHHIVSDGWSINIFTKEFPIFYEAARSGNAPSLPPLQRQYVDYSISQRQLLEGEKLKSLLSYWRNQLEGAPSVLGLPLDHPRPARQSFKGALHSFNVPRASLPELKSLCRETGVVPFMALLSAFKVLLFRYTNQSKIVVGTPIANRTQSDLEMVIGFFANTLVLCSSISSGMSFRELLAQVRDTTLGAYAHQELPFEKLVSELQPERSLSHNPVFQVMFIFQNLPAEKSNVRDAARPAEAPPEPVSLDVNVSKFDLTLALTETEEGFSAVFEYATDLFEPDTIERMAGHFVNTLEHVIENPNEQLGAFSLLSPEEHELILERWNGTGREWPEFQPLHGGFERWVKETPNATALIFQDEELSYEEFDRRANRVARLLRSRGVNRGSIVGICLHRSIEMVTGLFAILKAGAAYMPIEPDFPEGRVAYMLKDAGVREVLTTSDCLRVLSKYDVNAIALDDLESGSEDDATARPITLTPGDLAYVLFTSGSTGQPKGVMVSHGAIYNRLQWMQEAYRLDSSDRVMQKTPYTFDVSLWEFFWPLSEGACLVIAEPARHKESVYLVELIRKRRVTCLHFVPSMLQLFLHEDLSGCDSLKRIICSGEALTIEQCRKLQGLPGVSAHNLYGPTEAAVDVTHWDCDQWRDQYLSVPIGRPIANTQIYILNEKLQPCPIGVAGELHIGGHNLAQGYLNKPELTQRQFIPNPFAKSAAKSVNARLYKTGDLARFRSDGNIEYIGRIDSQVKLRGLRIELGEIESVLSQYPGVAEAIVIVHKFGDHDERLAAYVVPDNPEASIEPGEVAAFIAKKLPNYMVPSTIMMIPELPLSANGKLDRKKLPQPVIARISEPMAPVNEIERELLAIWSKYLKVDYLQTNDDFFALGGHSILVTQVINSINAHYHLNVPVRLLFENPTVKALARALSEFEDDAWLDETRTAAAFFNRSNLRVLQSLDEMSEEQVDEFIKHQIDDSDLARFEDIQSLLGWSRGYSTSRGYSNTNGRRPAIRGESAKSSNGSHESADSIYFRYYLELSRTRAAMEGIRLRELSSAASGKTNGSDEMFAALREQGSRIFESYTREIRQKFAANGHGTIGPVDLRDCCSQLLSMADLAESIKRF